MLPCFECMKQYEISNVRPNFRFPNRDEWCLPRQKDGTCKLHDEYVKSFDEVNKKRIGAIEVCKECCNKNDKPCGSRLVNAELMGLSKRLCPLKDKWYTTNEQRMNECQYKIIMATKGLL